MWRVPASALETGDRQTITASAATESGSRTATRAIPNAAVSIELQLPAGLSSASATFGPPQQASWQGTGDWDLAYFYAADPDFTTLFDALVTPEYIAEAGPLTSIEMPVPTSVPGWNAAWQVPGAAGLEWSLVLTRRLDGLDADLASWHGSFP